MFYYIKFRVLVWNHDVLQSWFILWVFHRAAYLCMASVWLSGATSQRQTQGFFQPAAPKGIWGRSVFHPNHRIYLPSSEGQPVRGDRVCLEKGRGPECVCVCLSVCFVWVHVCLRGGELDWGGTVIVWHWVALRCLRTWMSWIPKEKHHKAETHTPQTTRKHFQSRNLCLSFRKQHLAPRELRWDRGMF